VHGVVRGWAGSLNHQETIHLPPAPDHGGGYGTVTPPALRHVLCYARDARAAGKDIIDDNPEWISAARSINYTTVETKPPRERGLAFKMFTVELDTLLMVRRLLHQAGYGTGETNHDGLHVLMGAEIRAATRAADLAVDAAKQASDAGCEPSEIKEARLAAAATGKLLHDLRRQFDSKLQGDLRKISEEVRSLSKWTTPFSIIMKSFDLGGLSLVHGQKPDGTTWCTASYGGKKYTGTAPATPNRPTPLIVLGNPTTRKTKPWPRESSMPLRSYPSTSTPPANSGCTPWG